MVQGVINKIESANAGHASIIRDIEPMLCIKYKSLYPIVSKLEFIGSVLGNVGNSKPHNGIISIRSKDATCMIKP